MAIQCVNPATGEVGTAYPELTPAEVDTILNDVVKAQKEWAQTSFATRAKAMKQAGVLLRERAKELAKLMATEMGKPLKDGVAEANKCALACDYYADHSEEFLAPREIASDAGKSYVRYDPLGVILAVMPWNFPFWQVFRFIAPHIMAGNAGLLKHAANVPGCAMAIEKIMVDAGFPPNVFRNLMLESKRVAAVIHDPRVAAVTLTGSEGAGRAVGEAAGKSLKPAVLELGGADPFIVLADADLDKAAKVAAQGRLINAGQSCICAKRFIVVDSVYETFIQKFATEMKKVTFGDPLDPATDIGPLARVDLRDEVHSQVKKAVAEGAKLVFGGTVPEGKGAFYPPTMLGDVKPDNSAAQEEIFGPVATVMRANDADHAVELANNSRFGLGAGLWTQNRATADRLIPKIEAGAVFVNGLVKSDPRLPFGGIKASGFGRELGREGIYEFVNVKTVWIA